MWMWRNTFLFEAKQGYCVEFATALAVLCLYADIPARVASGFILQERDPETGEFIVREAHRHLWTEVYFEGVGWVAFDATRNAPVIEGGANDALTGEAAEQARRQWLQRALDVLIGAVVLAMLTYSLRRAWVGGQARRRPAPSDSTGNCCSRCACLGWSRPRRVRRRAPTSKPPPCA
jgi:transglutaminase-like putative cysteine protease